MVSIAMSTVLWFAGKIVSSLSGQSLEPMHAVLVTWCMGFVEGWPGTLSLVGNKRRTGPQDHLLR